LVSATVAVGQLDALRRGGSKPPVLLTFQVLRLRVRNACNNMGGYYKLFTDKLEVGNLMQTMMACESELMTRESAIKTRLQESLRGQYDAATSPLTPINDAGVMLFEPVDK